MWRETTRRGLLTAAAGAALATLAATVAVPALAHDDAPAAAGAPAHQPGSAATAGPLAGFSTHLVARHWLDGRGYTAEHFFKEVRPGVLQGLVVRDLGEGAPVTEVEWAITPEVYATLPKHQRRHWHSLATAVDAGHISVPGATPEQERQVLAHVRTLHAQTLNLAGIDGGLPTGPRGVRPVTHLAPGTGRATATGHGQH